MPRDELLSAVVIVWSVVSPLQLRTPLGSRRMSPLRRPR